MFRHNLRLVYRNFLRFKGTFIINLIGLSTGLACVLLIYLWVNDELSMDKFHKYENRLYRAMELRIQADRIWTATSSPEPLAKALVEDMPEVESAVTTGLAQPYTLTARSNENLKAHGRAVSRDFFKIFSYDLVQGNEDQVIADKSAIVISDELAIRLFNTTEGIVGKSIKLDLGEDYMISGVFRKVPANSSEQFDFVFSLEKLKERYPGISNWGNTGPLTYVLLREGVDLKTFNAKIADYIKVKTENTITYRTLFMRPYSEGYLYGKYENGVQAGGRITYVKLFTAIALFILVIACINFMNLSTAKASRRIKEVGIKKAVGAGRRILILQYMSESIALSFLSLVAAILLVDLILPQFNTITGKHLDLVLNRNMIGILLTLTLFTGFLAGSYPALYLSSFNPATVLKGKLNTSLGELWARKGLVVFQFVLSILLIVSVVVVYKQIEYIQSKNLGYNKDNVIHFGRNGSLQSKTNLETFLSELNNIPGVVKASSTSHDLTGHNSGTSGLKWEGRDPEDKTEFENFTVNHDMIETLDIEMVAGRTFSRDFRADTASIIFNEAGIEFMGLKDPLGKTVVLWGREMQIIGIVKNFHFESLYENIKPAFFRYDPGNTYHVMARIASGKEKETIAGIQRLYEKINPGFAFEYSFLDDDYAQQYIAEQRVATLSRYFASLAILISCLGLFGLAAFTAERRLKEIGIRKVLGSTEFGIVVLLSKDFTRIVLTSIVIALPLSYFLTSYWLEDFVFRTPLHWWYFASAGVTALIIAWLTVGSQAIKAANINPSKCLKDE